MKFPPLRSYVIGTNAAINRIMVQKGFEIAAGLADAEVVIWQGGEDVAPYLYGENCHPQTHYNDKRDKFEFACYKATKGKLRIGICRGGQFLNVMNGGFLYQHCDGHAGQPHSLRYRQQDGSRNITTYHQRITSTHHQIIGPNPKAEIWGTASESNTRETGIIRPDGSRQIRHLAGDHNSDVEICYYPVTRSLCFQPHPEYNSMETRELFFECVERALAE